MFDIGATELLLLVIVAVLVIGPKDMPLALRTAGKWMGKIRRISSHFRSGVDTMIREAEMEEMEKKWKDQNAKIMAETPAGEMGPISSHNDALADDTDTGVSDAAGESDAAVGAEAAVAKQASSKAEASGKPAPPPVDSAPATPAVSEDEPPLPFGKPQKRD